MKTFIQRLYQNSAVRYIIVGGMTTFVNLAVFSLLRYVLRLGFTVSNFSGIVCAIIFAFYMNKVVVFRSRDYTVAGWVREGAAFVGGRLFTMLVELILPLLLIGQMGMHDFLAKLLVQVIILILNFIISKCFVFGRRREPLTMRQWYAKNISYVWSVGITAVLMLIVWIANKLGPFGGHNMMLIDGIHQYVPFFSEYYEKLMNGGSLQYTWNVGMGGNFLSLFAYYLASPLNLLLLVFDKGHLTDGISLVLTLKILLTSFTMTYFLKHKRDGLRQDILIVALSLAYTFNTYVVGYNWCTMWMDVIMIFPLILLGFERLMERGDYRLYCLCLFYGLFCNYYIGFIVCVFLVFWFFMYTHRTVKNFFVHGIRFAIASLMSGAMAAFVLLPAYFGIMNTASGGDISLPKSSWYGNILDILQKLLAACEPITNQTFDGGANLYCGCFVLMGAVLFLLQKKIALWTRIRYVLMLAFLAASMNNELLNYIWHAFHNQYGIPNRFSFLFIMLLILMTEQALRHLHSKKNENYVLICTIFLMLSVLGLYAFCETKLPVYCYIVSVIFIDIYCVLSCLYASGKLRKRTFAVLFTIFASIEMVGNGIYGFVDNGSVNTDQYLCDTESVSLLKEFMEKESGTEFFRADLLKSRMLDEATWHNLHSIGIFGSTVPGHMVTAMGKLGFYTGANEYLYHGSTPLTNSLLNVKYALVREDAYNRLGFRYVVEEGGVSLFENPYYLPIGFIVNDALADLDMATWDVFDMQNNIVHAATDIQTNLFTKFDVDCEVSSDNGSVTFDGSLHQLSYTRQNTNATKISAVFEAPMDMDLYVNCKGSNIKNITLYIDDLEQSQERHQGQIFHIGQVTAGQKIELEYLLNSGGNLEGTLNLYSAYYDSILYEEVYRQLSETVMTEVAYKDGSIEGQIDCLEDGLLFTSIPYDDGWRVYVDGIEYDITELLDGFIGVELEKSTHKIEFKYTTDGLKYGIILSVAGWCIFAALAVLSTKRKKPVFPGAEPGEESIIESVPVEAASQQGDIIKKGVSSIEEANQEGDYSGSRAGDAIPSGDQGDSQGDASDSGYSNDSVHYSGSGGQRD
ncbi:MAG: YfhO family protein [Lachnospiraceae bacterium]|nr:YfhO family protein [Lachnospiraceae bacterium]